MPARTAPAPPPAAPPVGPAVPAPPATEAPVLAWGTFSRPRFLLFVGVAALLALSAWSLNSQPARLDTADTAGWPLRAALLGGMFGVWAFLMEPPRPLRWGLVAVAVPTA